jgi:hypothetical protein
MEAAWKQKAATDRCTASIVPTRISPVHSYFA